MTEFYFPNTINKNKNEKNKLYDITLICSYIISHPLYFSYLVFFSPYIFKLFSFLSPLFFTTFLLFLSLVTALIPVKSIINSNDGLFLAIYAILIENFGPNFEYEVEELLAIEEFEVYKIVFEVDTIDQIEANPVEIEAIGENPVEKVCQLEEKTVDSSEKSSFEPETGDIKIKRIEEKEEKKQDVLVKISEFEVNEGKKEEKIGDLKVKNEEKFFEAFPQTVEQTCLGSFRSMRKEKEWRRTLACKLFEERHNWSNNNINLNNNNEDNEEIMDLLWETNETQIKKEKIKSKEHESNKNKKGNKRNKENPVINKTAPVPVVPTPGVPVFPFTLKKSEKLERNKNEDESEEYEEYEENGKICCLQAFKLSAGKMNLSMGNSNLGKISKAFKSIGWLHSNVKKHKNKRV